MANNSSHESPVSHGLRSPMHGTVAGSGKQPGIAANTTMSGSAPRSARVQSPMKPKNPGKA